MTEYVYKVYCEWDCGQDWIIFATEELANKWLSVNAMVGTEIDTTYSELIEEGLVGVERLKFIKETK